MGDLVVGDAADRSTVVATVVAIADAGSVHIAVVHAVAIAPSRGPEVAACTETVLRATARYVARQGSREIILIATRVSSSLIRIS